jgi:uncharacterized lipoprotein YajG
MPMKSVTIFLAGAILLAGCAQHRLTVPRPDPTGQPVTVNSNAFLFGVRQPRTKAECPTNLLAEVRVHQNLLQALATVVTLGLWQPTRLEYRCAKVPVEGIGTMEEGDSK